MAIMSLHQMEPCNENGKSSHNSIYCTVKSSADMEMDDYILALALPLTGANNKGVPSVTLGLIFLYGKWA